MYAKKFRKSGINGKVLQDLTSQRLEFDLGVTNVSHRRELLCTIRSLCPLSTFHLADSLNFLPQPFEPETTKTFESNFEVVNESSRSITRGISDITLRYPVPSEADEDSYNQSESFHCCPNTSTDEGLAGRTDFTCVLGSDYPTLGSGEVMSSIKQ